MKPLSIHKIEQRGPRSFVIDWNDGSHREYALCDVQRACPCAGCQSGCVVDDRVSATKVESVGRYALRIHFTSGCSQGIYSYDLLKNME